MKKSNFKQEDYTKSTRASSCSHIENSTRRNFIKGLTSAGLLMSMPFISPFASTNAYALPRSIEELKKIPESVVKTSVTYGAIPSINKVEYLSMADANLTLSNEDVVFIIKMPNDPNDIRIVSQSLMVWHEVVNFHEFDGSSYSLTYSPLSASVAFYDTKINRQNLILDANGQLYNSNSVLIDRNTGSLWSQLLGLCFEGPLLGRGFTQEPVLWTKWLYAKKVFKTAKVVAHPKVAQSRLYGRDPYGSFNKTDTYYQDNEINYPITHFDRRMHPKTLVYAIEENKAPLAVDMSYIKKKKVVNFYLGPRALVAFYDKDLDTTRIFDRSFWHSDKPALFTYKNNTIQDFLTKSVWTADGKCISGNLVDASMQEIFGIYSFWFAYAAMHPETFTVPGENDVPDFALDAPLS